MRQSLLILLCFFACIASVYSDDATYGISGNPGAINSVTGTGDLGKLLQIPESSGVRLGGMYIADGNALLNGRENTGSLTGNSVLILDLLIDLKKAMGWKGALFGTEFLQFNGQATNADAGVVQGYNSLTGSPPLNRSELYQLWLLQKFAEDRFSIRIGKTIPIAHFNNVSKPVPIHNAAIAIPSVSGLTYTPIFVNTTLLGAIGGYYNSVYGVTVSVAPVKAAYMNLGFYDGSLARGIQTGIKVGPHFNGYYFSIMEVGYSWASTKPGIVAVGGWHQSGKLKYGNQTQTGTGGIYSFASQTLWTKPSTSTNKGNISGFLQFGWSNSRILEMNLFAGAGLTAFALLPKRPNDSFGVGLAWSRLNPHRFSRYSELMLQGYYQLQILSQLYFESALSYIPNPGAHPNRTNVLALTNRFTLLF
ncbi:MAG: carbohydrate porin [Verrucomicrobia bacterium]|nr:carbohydrate porin [Verrucomicrobiota bacterium]